MENGLGQIGEGYEGGERRHEEGVQSDSPGFRIASQMLSL